MLPVMLQKYYTEDDIFGIDDFVLAKGNIPICLVAHCDTVHLRQPKTEEIIYDKISHSYSSPVGIGADDRAGIMAILEILERGYRPHVLFTTDEEIGGIGADFFVTVFPTFPYDLKYFIQIDRRGTGQAVYYDGENDLFEFYISEFGFDTQIGSFTDIVTFMQEYDIAGVNLSAGYVSEHTKVETLYVDGLDYTINGIERMLLDYDNADYFDAQVKYGGFSYGYSNYNYADNWGKSGKSTKKSTKSKYPSGWDFDDYEEEEDEFSIEPIDDVYKHPALFGMETMICAFCGEEFEADLNSMYAKCTGCGVTQSTN